MANVKTVQDSGDTAALLVLDDGTKPIWTPDRELARTLLGKPIPADWLIKPNKQGTGNIALPPKKGGGGGGYRQSKEAFESEARSRAAWQEIEEERRDRRTALMQAVENVAGTEDSLAVIRDADLFYEWLRSSPAAGPAVATAGVATTEERPRTPPQAGAPTSVIGEEAGEEPGVGSVKTTPGPTTCTHRYPSGRWLPTKVVDGQARCPRCGESAIKYREAS